MDWRSEDPDDRGTIYIRNNEIRSIKDVVSNPGPTGGKNLPYQVYFCVSPTAQYLFKWDHEEASYNELARRVASIVIDDDHEFGLQHAIGLGQIVQMKREHHHENS